MNLIQTAADLSNNIYLGQAGQLPKGYGNFSIPSAGFVINDPYSGFYGAVYQSTKDNSVFVVYRGTDFGELNDTVADAREVALGTAAMQTNDAHLLFRAGVDLANNTGASLYVTGHSLGGYLAQYMVLGNRAKAIVFDAPGMAGSWNPLTRILDPIIFGSNTDITYVYSNPGTWSEKVAGPLTAGAIHTTGVLIGNKVFYLQNASSHSMQSIVDALDAGGQLLSEKEMQAILHQPNAFEQLAADGAHYFDSLMQGAVHQAMLQAAQGQCLPAHTQIQTSLTTSTAISNLRVGDIVMAFDPRADNGRGALVPKRVKRLYRNTTTEWIRLRWFDGEERVLVTTPGHHFLDQFGQFPTIEEMVRNGRTTVVLASGALAEVTADRITYSAETAHLFERATSRGAVTRSVSFLAWDAPLRALQ